MNNKAPRPATSVVAIARPSASLKWVAPCLLFFGLGLIVTDQIKPQLTNPVKMAVVDATTPVLSAIAHPVASVESAVSAGKELLFLHEENERLRLENERLRAWYVAAQRLSAENRDLRELVDYEAVWLNPKLSARVVADTGGAFARSVLIDHGRDREVAKGMPAVTSSGVVGRVQDVGHHSARILLMTDLNSRIPAMLEKNGERLVVAGDNSAQPRVHYVRADVPLAIGDQIVTSGVGGIFPAGLPLGTVTSLTPVTGRSELEARIQPSVNLSKLAIVSLLPTAIADDPLAEEAVPDQIELAPASEQATDG